MLGRGRDPPADVDVAVLRRFFEDKVAAVHLNQLMPIVNKVGM